MKVGDHVVFVDRTGVERPAVVTALWNYSGDDTREASVNVVIVNPDELMTDVYGRQIVRETSVPHRKEQNAPGYYWKRIGE